MQLHHLAACSRPWKLLGFAADSDCFWLSISVCHYLWFTMRNVNLRFVITKKEGPHTVVLHVHFPNHFAASTYLERRGSWLSWTGARPRSRSWLVCGRWCSWSPSLPAREVCAQGGGCKRLLRSSAILKGHRDGLMCSSVCEHHGASSAEWVPSNEGRG